MATTTTTAPVDDTRPSQSPEDAARDGIVPALAALTLAERLGEPTVQLRWGTGDLGPASFETPEGTWLLSQPDVDQVPGVFNGCEIGDPDGRYGIDRVCVLQYAEILLLAPETGEIVKAVPFDGLRPQQLALDEDALYCIRAGDGAVLESMLCRIDRASLDVTVRVFPLQGADGDNADLYRPDWIVNEPHAVGVWLSLMPSGEGLTIAGPDGSATVDPLTLELIEVQRTDG